MNSKETINLSKSTAASGSSSSKKVDPAEIETAFNVCVDIIDNPPEEYKLVKQAVLGIVHLTARRDDLRANGMLKILQVVKDANKYRSNPRRYAVHSLASMAYYDEKLIAPCIQVFSQLVKPSSENSQYVRKATFVALSRIGRRYPSLQDQLIPIFSEYYHNSKIKESVLWGIIIGLGRMAQSNALLRSVFAKEWIKWCGHKSFRLRWAGIKGLGHACCSIGNVVYDPDLAQQCFEIASGFLKHGGVEAIKQKIVSNSDCQKELEESWKEEHVYLVQYAATQALGLLLRSNPDMWWGKISPIFGELLLNPYIAVMIKAMILITYGKIAYYLESTNPYYSSIYDLLSSLSVNENILVAEPATYGLVNFALAHDEYYDETKRLVASKLQAPVSQASKENLQYYLKTWCKIIARDYQPILNLCSKVISEHSAHTLASLKSKYATNWTVGSFGTQTDEDRKLDLRDSMFKPQNLESNTVECIEIAVRKMINDPQAIFELCTNFSYRVLQSIFVMLEDIAVLDDRAFLENLKKMITIYSGKIDKADIDQKGLSELISQLQKLDPVLRESALRVLKDPDILDDPLWLSNLKLVLLSQSKGTIACERQQRPFLADDQFLGARDLIRGDEKAMEIYGHGYYGAGNLENSLIKTVDGKVSSAVMDLGDGCREYEGQQVPLPPPMRSFDSAGEGLVYRQEYCGRMGVDKDRGGAGVLVAEPGGDADLGFSIHDGRGLQSVAHMHGSLIMPPPPPPPLSGVQDPSRFPVAGGEAMDKMGLHFLNGTVCEDHLYFNSGNNRSRAHKDYRHPLQDQYWRQGYGHPSSSLSYLDDKYHHYPQQQPPLPPYQHHLPHYYSKDAPRHEGGGDPIYNYDRNMFHSNEVGGLAPQHVSPGFGYLKSELPLEGIANERDVKNPPGIHRPFPKGVDELYLRDPIRQRVHGSQPHQSSYGPQFHAIPPLAAVPTPPALSSSLGHYYHYTSASPPPGPSYPTARYPPPFPRDGNENYCDQNPHVASPAILPIFLKPQIVPPLLPENQKYSTFQPPTDHPTVSQPGSFIFNRFPDIDEENTAELFAAYVKSAKYGEYCGFLSPLLASGNYDNLMTTT